LERLVNWRLPAYGAKEAEAALADCRLRLERRLVETEKQAMAALLAAREEELGASSLVEAVVSGTGDADETVKEAVNVHRRDLETGLRLHGKERKEESGDTAETNVNG
jgi:hypothetical protein